MVNPPVIFPWKAESRAARVSAVALDPRFCGGDERSTSSRAIRVAGAKAFAAAGITLNEADHLMIYDAPGSLSGASFAHLPIHGLEDQASCPAGGRRLYRRA